MIDWSHLPFLLAAVRAGSLAKAARKLRVDPATVGRHVSALEREVDAKLLRRLKGGGLEPTEVGARLLAAAARTEEGLAEASRVARAEHEALRGTVRVTTVDVLAMSFIVPAIPRLQMQHPELVLDLSVTPQLLDLSRDADLSLRLTRPADTTLVARRAGTLELAAYATEAIAARVDGEGLPVVAYGEQFIKVPENAWIERLREPRVVLRTTSVGAAVTAAESGVGAAMVPVRMVSPSLVRLDALGTFSRDVWIVVHPDLAKSPRVRAVSDFLVEAISGPPKRRKA